MFTYLSLLVDHLGFYLKMSPLHLLVSETQYCKRIALFKLHCAISFEA
jgi:hypothetical protein